MNPKTKAWSKAEDEILSKFYPTEGVRVMSRLPGRSEYAIRSHAAEAGIKMTREARAKCHRPKKESAQANVRAATPAPRNLDEARARGMIGDLYGRTAGTKETLQPVPDSALGMPWVKYPKSVADCRGIITRCTYVLDEFGVNMSAGERAYFESSRKYAQATLQRLESTIPA